MICPRCGANITDDSQFCGYCGFLITDEVKENIKKKEKMKKRNLIVSITSMVIIIVLVLCYSFSRMQKSNISNDAKLNIDNYNQIQIGMSYYEVVEILGKSKGASILSNENRNIEMHNHKWANKGNTKDIMIMFKNNKVYSKGQAGLEKGELTDVTKIDPLADKSIQVKKLPAESKTDGITVGLTNVIQDPESLRVYITYINNSDRDYDLAKSYGFTKIIFNKKAYYMEYDSYTKNLNEEDRESEHLTEKIKAHSIYDSVVFFTPIEGINKAELVIAMQQCRLRFNNIIVETK